MNSVCPHCGSPLPPAARFCTVCGKAIPVETIEGQLTPPPPVPPPLPSALPPVRPYVPNYLVQSILVTIFCCVPFGIPAIVFAAQVNSKLAWGDVDGAIESSNKAKMWGWIAFGVGLVFNFLVFGLQMAGFIASAAQQQ